MQHEKSLFFADIKKTHVVKLKKKNFCNIKNPFLCVIKIPFIATVKLIFWALIKVFLKVIFYDIKEYVILYFSDIKNFSPATLKYLVLKN